MYEYERGRFGDQATVIEVASDIPPLDVLLAEAATADLYREAAYVL